MKMFFPLWLVFLTTVVKCQDTTLSLTSANTRFALDAYRQLGSQSGNLFFSPLSISIVMGMLYEGSNTTTRAQLEKVGSFGMVKDLAPSFRELSSILNTPSKDYQLAAANRVYARKNYSFRQTYLQTIQSQYQSDVIESDFRFNAEGVRQEINKWVEDKTKDKIKNLIPKNALKPNTAMVLVNAMYFKGDWAQKFLTKSTESKTFYLSKQQTVNTDMMYQKAKFQVFSNYNSGYRVLELPYKGNHLSMLVVLPTAIDGLANVEKLMTKDEISSIHNNLKYSRLSDVMVTLPKFKIDQKYKMKEHLTKMGLGDLFKARVCDLSGIDDTRDLYVSEMFHQAFVDVNEEGSEAAAATGTIISKTMSVVRPNFPTEFKADHPFIFYIRDNRSGSVLFMGRYEQP